MTLFAPQNRNAIIINGLDDSKNYTTWDINFRWNLETSQIHQILSSSLPLRETITYDSITTFSPNQPNYASLTQGVLHQFQISSTDETLTLLYLLVNTYNKWQVKIDHFWTYILTTILVEELSKIAGKKVIITVWEYSGKILSAVDKAPDREDYAVITSTAAGERWTSSNDGIIHSKIITWMKQWDSLDSLGKSVKSLRFDKTHPQTPQTFVPFDVVV